MRVKQFSLTFIASTEHSEWYDAVVHMKPKGTYSYIYYSIFPENGAYPYEGVVCNTIATGPYFKVPHVSPFENYFIVLYEVDAYSQQPLQKIWEMFYSEFTMPFSTKFNETAKYDISLVGPLNNSLNTVNDIENQITNKTTNDIEKEHEEIDKLLAELDAIVIDSVKSNEENDKEPNVVYILDDYFQNANDPILTSSSLFRILH